MQTRTKKILESFSITAYPTGWEGTCFGMDEHFVFTAEFLDERGEPFTLPVNAEFIQYLKDNDFKELTLEIKCQ